MSLDLSLRCKCCGNAVFDSNITHNLNTMAGKAGLYEVLWRPDENGFPTAGLAIPTLRAGIKKLEEQPDYFRQFNPGNGWGDYEGLLNFAKEFLAACAEHPEATIHACR